jgi:hypothetical protein
VTFRRGLRRSPASATSHRLGAQLHPRVAAALAAGPKGSADLSGHLATVFNQSNSSTCWAHAAANLKYAALSLSGVTPPFVPSPLYFAQCVYAADRAASTPPGQPLPPLVDTGAELGAAAEVFTKWGDIPLQAPQQGGATDVPATSDVFGNPVPLPELSVPEVQAGLRDPFGGSYDIAVDANAPSLLMATLDAGILVWDGFYCGPRCEALGPNDVLNEDETSGGGGHSTLYWGYDLNASRKWPVDGPVFFKRNSWGVGYCRGGDFTVGKIHVVNAWELRPFVLGSGS